MTDTPRRHGDLIRALIRGGDDADLHTIGALTSSNVHFRFGNADPTDSQAELIAAARSFRDAIADLRHTFLELWELDEGTVIGLMDVYYRRLDGHELNLPCCNVFRVHDGLVDD